MKSIIISITIAVAGVLIAGAPVSANTNNITFNDYDIDYVLSRDADGRSVLSTTETIVAEFHSRDTNRGIERAIPKSYDGHTTSLDIVSVQDEHRADLPYTTHSDGEYTVLQIGDADKYVNGQHTYVLTYTQRDVTKQFSSSGAATDEFYWDTNGTEWKVPITSLDVSLEIDDSLAGSLTGQYRCYVGGYGSSEHCDVSRDGNVYTASAGNLSIGSNMSLAIGFRPQTFSAYEQSALEKALAIWMVVQGVLIAVSSGILALLVIKYSSWSRRKKEVGTIIPEYLPPPNSSVSLSETLITSQSSFAAQLIDFAVRHYIKIYEIKEAKLLSPAVYEMEIIKPIDDLRDEEKEFLKDVFRSVQVGSKTSTEKMSKDYTLSTRLLDNPKKIQNLKRNNYGIQQKSPEKSAWFKRFGVVLLIFGVILLSPPLLFTAVVSFALGAALWVLTDKGLSMYRYLQGLKMYISVAEAERLKMLQSPEGAEKVQVDATDPKKLIKLYERVLPYAVLFGQEKEWSKQLGSYYMSAGAQPDWYTGVNLSVFNAAVFSNAMTGLANSISSTGASFSSSGGSSGGGFSGGGGGGGGGGGW